LTNYQLWEGDTLQLRLKIARIEAMKTQKEMADGLTEAGFRTSIYTYNKKELGHRKIYVEEGVAMARMVRKPTEDLFG
jgi:DNA-binding XRE family transcriptional regulator